MDKSDKELEDKSGVKIYELIKSRTTEPFVLLNILNQPIYLVTDINCIEKILQNSPNPFNVGILKYQFFKSFMKNNLGVSQGKEWKRRRIVNDEVLHLDRRHELTRNINIYIKNLINSNSFNVFEDFLFASKKLATKIVFNKDEIADEIFDFFEEVNNVKHYENKDYKAPKYLRKNYYSYMNDNIEHPEPNSLVEIGRRHESDKEEL